MTKIMYKDIEYAGGTVDSTPIPTSYRVSEFDSDAHMNSTDMTTGSGGEVEDFIDGLNITGGLRGDYVVEQGTSGNWAYRKWNSGVAECWGLHSKTISGVSGSTPFSGYCFAFGSISFPTSFFNATPVVSVAGQVASNYMCVCYNSASSTGVNVELQSNVSGSRTCVVHIYAIGKWK